MNYLVFYYKMYQWLVIEDGDLSKQSQKILLGLVGELLQYVKHDDVNRVNEAFNKIYKEHRERTNSDM